MHLNTETRKTMISKTELGTAGLPAKIHVPVFVFITVSSISLEHCNLAKVTVSLSKFLLHCVFKLCKKAISKSQAFSFLPSFTVLTANMKCQITANWKLIWETIKEPPQ